jgi:transcriptional regulator with XRE-family HTH domain
MLIWAREEIGYSLEQASDALGVSVDTLRAAESGEKSLTLNQLLRNIVVHMDTFTFQSLRMKTHINQSLTFVLNQDLRVSNIID